MSEAPNNETNPLKLKARQVSKSIYAIDFIANVGIRVGGVFVVLAVLGMVAFIFSEVIPLFLPPGRGVIVLEKARPLPGRTMLLACDEYRRTAVRVSADGSTQMINGLTGETLVETKLEPFKNTQITAMWTSPRSTATIAPNVESSSTEHLVVAGSSNGELWQGKVIYRADFMRLPLNPAPELLESKGMTAAEWKEVSALPTPDEQQTKQASYAPGVALIGSGDNRAVVEHMPNDFQFYRKSRATVTLPRRIEMPTNGVAIVDVGVAVEVLPEAEKPHEMITGAITADGRVLLKVENMSLNMSDEWEGEEVAQIELTKYITGAKPRFIRVRGQRDQAVVVTEDGKLYTFKRDKRDFVPEFEAGNLFKPIEGKSWAEHVNNLRQGRGLPRVDAAPRVTCVEYLIGDITLLVGDSLGGIQCWFSTKANKDAPAGPLARTRVHSPSEGAIVGIVTAQTQKSFVVTDDSGGVRAIHNTSEREFFADKVAPGAVYACSPLKEEGFIAVGGDGRMNHWWVHAPHTDISFGALVAPVWYESYPEPITHWESTTGSADVEAKFSMVPLVVGTLKGGLYALLVAIPLALLGAVYTSEFMHRKMRSVVKPSMEIMASLPSVVLGFLAAMYFAPEAAPRMPTLIVAFFVCPAFFLLYGWMFQQLPPSVSARFTPVITTITLFVILFVGLGVSSLVGPRFEQVLFPAVESADPALVDARTFQPVNEAAARRLDTGDFRSWTSGGAVLAMPTTGGNNVAVPRGWWIPGGHALFKFLMWIPFGLLLAWGLKVLLAGGNFFGRPVKQLVPARVLDFTSIVNRARAALSGGRTAGLWPVVVNIGISLVGVAVVAVLAFGVTSVLSPIIEGLLFNYPHPTAGSVADFRRFVTGPEGWKYTQTNSLIVGFAMGFAVIPIIYSIAEDALSTVPNHMRAASLACGASRWQTTVRIVIPAAASGIFSAIVIGLGRAVGETMIVVMAAGGTPVMDMQPLVGFRSLSAAIATEIAEAPDASTHRRVLFLGGLVLFLMTFLMSTLAEFVRMRLRKKLNRM